MMVLEKGGKGWRPEILPPSSEAEELEMIASRLQVDPKDIDHVWENKLGRLVGKDGTLNTVNKRRLYHWAVWQYKSLMRYSWLSLLLWSITIYFIFTIIVAAILYWSNEESKSGIRSLIQNDTIFIERKQIEEQHINWSEVDSPYSAFLLAIEMIMTIGYGTRGPNSSSAVASNLTMLINVISLTINSIFSGLFLAWVMRSQAAKIKFSSVAVITKREGCLALMVRLADPVASGLAMLEVSGFCVLVKRDPSCQDESSRWVELRHMGDMTFTAFSKGSQSILPLMWPTVVVHWINASSPLFTFSPEVLQTHSLEIIINVSGIREATGSRILCKTSYIR